jgi:hypothetical protein
MPLNRLELDRTLLRMLLEKEIEEFRTSLEGEDPGLSPTEIERYVRAARKFAAQLAGDTPRTRGRKARVIRPARPSTVESIDAEDPDGGGDSG